MTADDLEPLEPDGLHTLTLDQRARLAADGLRRATVMQPPPLGGRKLGLEGWARVAGLVVVVVLVAIGVTVLASDNRGSSEAAHKPKVPSSAASVVQVAAQLAAGKFDAIAGRLELGPPFLIDGLFLRGQWGLITEAYGDYRGVGSPTQIGPQVAAAPLAMSKGQVDLVVALQPDGRLAAVYFEPTLLGDRPPLTFDDIAPKATEVAHALEVGDFQAAVQDFDPLARVTSGPAQLRETWQQLLRAYGPLQSIGFPVMPDAGYKPGPFGFSIVNVALNMRGGVLRLQVMFDGNGQIQVVAPLLPNPPSSAVLGNFLQASTATADRAQSVVGSLAGESYQAVIATFDQLAAANVTATALRQQWQTTTDRLGQLTRTDPPVYIASLPSSVTYEIGLAYRHGDVHVQVSLDTQNRVQELLILPGPPTRVLGS